VTDGFGVGLGTSLLELLPLAILGGVLGLDVVSFPQAMISRPLVAATLAGALVGEPGRGIVVGVALEFFALETLPFGASRYPEWGSAAVVGGALFAANSPDSPGALMTAVLGALLTAAFAGRSMVQMRKLNARWARARLDALARGSERTVVRGGLITWIALALLGPVVHASVHLWTVEARLSRAIVVGVAATVAAGAVWKIFHTTPGARWFFLSGIAVGLALLAMNV
jgi:PTS system mannose-specific IIC component